MNFVVTWTKYTLRRGPMGSGECIVGSRLYWLLLFSYWQLALSLGARRAIMSTAQSICKKNAFFGSTNLDHLIFIFPIKKCPITYLPSLYAGNQSVI